MSLVFTTRERTIMEEDSSTDETAATRSLIDRLRNVISERAKKEQENDKEKKVKLRRDVHVKMHGTMRAEFTVGADLPLDLRVGLFANPGTYQAWVRFSNADRESKPDRDRDIRGMAIKVMGVPGLKVLATERDATTHDFILISADRFTSRTPGEFDELVAAVLGNHLRQAWYFLTHLRVGWILWTKLVRPANILQLPYFSAVPYEFGTQVVKYVATPHDERHDRSPHNPSHNFLREVAAKQLAQQDALFDFAVQFQRDEASMPVDDPTRVWSLDLSPPRRVASLRILKQDFNTKAIDDFGENLSFTPWHCLPEHRPLGAINDARKVIYETLSAFRHAANDVPQREPTPEGVWM